MKKIVLGLLSLILCFTVFAQDKEAAQKLLIKTAKEAGLNDEELKNFFISDTYTSNGITMVYANQEYKNVPVMNQIYALSYNGEKLLSSAGSFIQNMAAATKNVSPTPSVTATLAVQSSFSHENIPLPGAVNARQMMENKFNFGQLRGVTEEVKATLLWVPIPLSTDVKLAWQVEVAKAGTEDYKLINIDAHTGSYINELNLTVYDKFDKNEIPALLKRPVVETNDLLAESNHQFTQSPSLVGTANYLVIDYPKETPSFGAATTVANPWLNAPGNASSLGWHNDGTNDYTYTRGNNVWATEDRAAVNTNTGLPATSTTLSDPLNFIFTPDYNVDPTTSNFQQFAVTNLFYWNNVVHDISYQYGFDEVAGNFQKSNLGRGGNGNDDVSALAQSGAGTNNANFSTPADGGRGRMRMYLFDAVPSITLKVNAPAIIAGNYTAVESGFSPFNKLSAVGPKTGQLVYFNDATSGTHEACTGAPSNSLTGKIALINRGACSFTIKVKEAQLAGAIAVIMVNSVTGAPIIMGGTDSTITIPAVMVSDVDGASFAAQLTNNVNVTLSGTAGQRLDGDLDAGIMAHEYGHGISNRFTGGPSAAGCLNNAEQGGEGWSDYIGLMMTTNWANATINDGTIGRGVGSYVVGQPSTGLGIRNYKYSTDLAINPLTYANVGTGIIGTEVHNIGEVWCMAIWEMTWGIIRQQGSINPNLYNFSLTNTGGNSIAMKLVYEGMKLQNCLPGFIDARNGILAADRNLYNGAHACTIWTAFAKRGMGFGASQGSSGSATDQTSTTIIPPAPAVTTQPVDVTVAIGANAVFTASAGSDPNLIYQWQVSTNGGSTYTDIIGEIKNTLIISNVTTAMGGNKYRARVFYACDFTNTNAATLNLAGAPTVPVITSQPANTTICAGTTAIFSVGATGANLTYKWQVSVNGGTVFTDITPAQITDSLKIMNVTVAMNNNQYRVIVTNAAGSVTSNVAVLTVTASGLSVITSQPVSTTTCSVNNASFSVTATGSSLTYKWQVSTNGGTTFTDIQPAVTTPTLTLTNVSLNMNGNQYRVMVTGGCVATTIISNAATLKVNAGNLTINTQPADVSVCVGSPATFKIVANGGVITYQWQVSTNGGASYTDIAGATDSSYTIVATTLAMKTYKYRVVLKNSCTPSGLNSQATTLTVGSGIAITNQPSSISTCAGTNVAFAVTATGAGLTYQWQVSTNSGTSFTNITGANSATLNLTAVTAAMNNYQYKLIINSSCTSVTSNMVILTVNTSVTITQQPDNQSVCQGDNAIFSVIATGTTISYQWQVSVNGGTYTNLANVAPYAGVTTSTLTIMNPGADLYGNTYRVFTNGTPCGGSTSNAAILTGNNKPSVVLSLSGTSNINPYTRTGLLTTVSPVGSYNYKWYKNGVLLPSLTTAQIPLTVSDLGIYYVVVTSNQGCSATSNSVTVSDSASSVLFIYPNPNTGKFKVSYYSAAPTSTRIITIHDSKGAMVYNKSFTTNGPYGLMDVQMSISAGGVYFVDVRNEQGKRIASSSVIIMAH